MPNTINSKKQLVTCNMERLFKSNYCEGKSFAGVECNNARSRASHSFT